MLSSLRATVSAIGLIVAVFASACGGGSASPAHDSTASVTKDVSTEPTGAPSGNVRFPVAISVRDRDGRFPPRGTFKRALVIATAEFSDQTGKSSVSLRVYRGPARDGDAAHLHRGTCRRPASAQLVARLGSVDLGETDADVAVSFYDLSQGRFFVDLHDRDGRIVACGDLLGP